MPLRAPSRKRCRASCHRWGYPRWRASGFRVRRHWGRGSHRPDPGVCRPPLAAGLDWPGMDRCESDDPRTLITQPEAPDAAGAHARHVRVLVTSWTATVRAHAAAPWTSDVVRATGESHIAITCAPTAARPTPSRVHQRRQGQHHRACTNGGMANAITWAPTAAKPAPSRVHQRRQNQHHHACTNGGQARAITRAPTAA
jgi:hypothetical protein